MIIYEAGTIPSQGLTIAVRDDKDNPVNVVDYDYFRLEMRGSDDEDVDLTGVNLVEVPVNVGIFAVDWPRNRSIFEKPGKYVLRLVLGKNNGAKDITRTAEIWVREFGRLN